MKVVKPFCQRRAAILAALFFAATTSSAAPGYPLYFIDEQAGSAEAVLSHSEIELLAKNFVFAHFGMKGYSSEVINAFHAINPNFVALRYASHQRADYGSSQTNAECHRMDLLYYRCATLSQAIGTETTEFKLNPVDGPIRLKAISIQANHTNFNDPTRKYVHWIRVENELMRIDEWNMQAKTIRVARGLDGTKPAAYPCGANVLAPIGSAHFLPDEPGFVSRYSYDPARPRRWEVSLASALKNAQDGFDGTWYDLIAADPFRPANVYGEPVTQVWDCERRQNYTLENYRLACEKGLDYVMRSYRDKTGKWPVIFINNLVHLQYYPVKGSNPELPQANPAEAAGGGRLLPRSLWRLN